ncbi:ganglioside-induced differentiation-associated protein 1 isoform X1 [Stegostoma tigrinum]|uniref:ganglioside-induced differentiation-associated protein 1 isoform X1 n=2 Tax=Stegostoma tigrinum TaxID=3053191 RepID=UPI00202ACD79|nr:ganglioside-induced differentiation-associated protein 1 isoform X1 [Stegostoma tigrinum]
MAAAQGEPAGGERCREMEVRRSQEGDGALQVVPKPENTREKMVLYHWSQSFSSQKVRLVIAEKGLKCEEYDVNLPLSEHNEPWFMRLNPAGEVPVLIHGDNIICESTQIIDYLENTFEGENIPKLMPEEGSLYYPRVQHYRELLDSLPIDAYTHGCILHPELTLDSMIPAYATTRIRSQIGNTESELKKLAEEHPDLREAYLAKQKQIKSKIRDHDNVTYLKKIFRELENVLDQVETELQRRIEETPDEGLQPWLCGDFFSLADVSLSVTLHRLKFLGLARKYWGNGKRPNLESYYDRVLQQRTFRKVLGNVNNILVSAVLPTAFRVAKKRAPSFLGASFIVSLLGGIGYLAFLFLKKRLS